MRDKRQIEIDQFEEAVNTLEDVIADLKAELGDASSDIQRKQGRILFYENAIKTMAPNLWDEIQATEAKAKQWPT